MTSYRWVFETEHGHREGAVSFRKNGAVGLGLDGTAGQLWAKLLSLHLPRLLTLQWGQSAQALNPSRQLFWNGEANVGL